jgi:DNA mismatch repair protein MutS
MVSQPPSLLWPNGRPVASGSRLNEQAIADLHLAEVIAAISGGSDAHAGRLAQRERFAREVLTELLSDPAIIGYRQAVLTDLLDNPSLRERVEQVLPALEALGDLPRVERHKPTAEPGLERVARRLADLELLVDAVTHLSDALNSAPMSSDGLRSLSLALADQRASPAFASLERELPGLRAKFASVRSVTIGVNLGPDLLPESATILEIGSTPVDGRRALLFRLLGGGSEKDGLTPLQRGEGGPLGRPNELTRDLRHLLSQVAAPVQAALERYSRIAIGALSQLGAELALLLGEARLVERLRSAGLPVCRPDSADADERYTELVDMYDVGLALALTPATDTVVTNDAHFDDRLGRVWVLTGPNRGGKSTFTRAIGLAQVFFQVGLCVPARSARMSPVDAIYTHFPSGEDVRPGLGRLDAEAERMAEIFHQATPRSLILLNEALSGTSALEALDLARGLVRALRLLGARAIYVTHLHELANTVDEINATTPGDALVASLLAGSSGDGCTTPGAIPGATLGARRTYRVVPGPPTGMSFAAEIAEQHGISFAQLARLLRERHLGL